jgi:hypothetical protein
LLRQRFGRLLVIGYSHAKVNRHWHCLCDCGRETIVNGAHLTSGHTQSCGCAYHRKYGNLAKENRVEYNTWLSMHKRCQNPVGKNKNYKGVSICERWNDFASFLDDMGKRPGKEYSIDRINSQSNYEPSNCRWATSTQQNRNRSNNHWITFNGKTQILEDWAREIGISPATIIARIGKGLPIEKVLRPISAALSRYRSYPLLFGTYAWRQPSCHSSV